METKWRIAQDVYVVFVDNGYGEEIEGVYISEDIAKDAITENRETQNDMRSYRIEQRPLWYKRQD